MMGCLQQPQYLAQPRDVTHTPICSPRCPPQQPTHQQQITNYNTHSLSPQQSSHQPLPHCNDNKHFFFPQMTTQRVVLMAVVMALAFIALAVAQPTPPAYDPLIFPSKPAFDAYQRELYTNMMKGETAIAASRTPIEYSGSLLSEFTVDTGLAIRAMERLYGTNSTDIGDIYARFEKNWQTQCAKNPGLDVRVAPKFSIDNYSTSAQGQVQLLGTAQAVGIRASLAMWLISRGLKEHVRNNMYMANGARTGLKWHAQPLLNATTTPSLDIWGEVMGTHFANLMAARRALFLLAQVAYTLDDADFGLECSNAALEITAFTNENMVNVTNSNIIYAMAGAAAATGQSRNHLDSAIVFGLLYNTDLTSPTTATPLRLPLNGLYNNHWKTLGCVNPTLKKNTATVTEHSEDVLQAMPWLAKTEQTAQFDACTVLYTLRVMTSSQNGWVNQLGPALSSPVAFNSLVNIQTWSRTALPVNKAIDQQSPFSAVLTGRYFNDRYNGTHSNAQPGVWPAVQFATAEAFVRMMADTDDDQSGQITFTERQLPWLKENWLYVQKQSSSSCPQSRLDSIVDVVSKTGTAVFKKDSYNSSQLCISRSFQWYGLQLMNVFMFAHGPAVNLAQQVSITDASVVMGGVAPQFYTMSYASYISFHKRWTDSYRN